jgi:hypothetical protein
VRGPDSYRRGGACKRGGKFYGTARERLVGGGDEGDHNRLRQAIEEIFTGRLQQELGWDGGIGYWRRAAGLLAPGGLPYPPGVFGSPPFLATRAFAGKELVAKTGLTGHQRAPPYKGVHPRTPPYTPVHARARTPKPQSVAIHLPLFPSRPPQPYTSVQGRAPPCMGVHGRACTGVHLRTPPYRGERAWAYTSVHPRTWPSVHRRAGGCRGVHARAYKGVHLRTWPYIPVQGRACIPVHGRTWPCTPVQGRAGRGVRARTRPYRAPRPGPTPT